VAETQTRKLPDEVAGTVEVTVTVVPVVVFKDAEPAGDTFDNDHVNGLVAGGIGVNVPPLPVSKVTV